MTNTAWFYLYKISLKQPNFLKQKVEWWLSRAERGRNGELMYSGCGVSVWHNEKSFRDLLPTLCIYLTIPYTLKWLRQWIRSFSFLTAKTTHTFWPRGIQLYGKSILLHVSQIGNVIY